MFLCILTLVLFTLPTVIERRVRIDLPDTLEIIILVFIFASEILGELGCFFINVPNWDSILHTTTGFLCAAFGFALIDINLQLRAVVQTIMTNAGQRRVFPGQLNQLVARGH